MGDQKRSGRGGKRAGAGAKPGVRLGIAHRESIRGAMLVDVLHGIAEGKIKGDPKRLAVRNTAALGLLKFQLPVMQAIDLTSGGEPFVIEQVSFKRAK